MDATTFAKYFDATNLKLDATREDLQKDCAIAAQFGFASVCLYPTDVALAASLLEGTGVDIATVVGFPSGRYSVEAKQAEILQAANQGAAEVDIVMNYSALIDNRLNDVAAELNTLADTAREEGLLSKIIVETCFLTHEQVLTSLTLCEDAGANFIKTSTGFGTAGAQIEHIKLWAAQRQGIKIKASGGIRTLQEAQAMIDAGADRLGVSSAANILREFLGETNTEMLTESY